VTTQTLVSILERHPAEFIDDREIAEYLVSALRCENCKHWDDIGYCRKAEGDDPRFRLAKHGDPVLRTAADFFCALFEEKQ
jgi:hypothetical protein